jgi:hypothetical protein
MQNIRVRRQPRQLVLDGLFVALLLHFFVTGHVVPSMLVDLFRDQPQIVVSVEPETVPELAPEAAPLNEDGEFPPETRGGGAAFGTA